MSMAEWFFPRSELLSNKQSVQGTQFIVKKGLLLNGSPFFILEEIFQKCICDRNMQWSLWPGGLRSMELLEVQGFATSLNDHLFRQVFADMQPACFEQAENYKKYQIRRMN